MSARPGRRHSTTPARRTWRSRAATSNPRQPPKGRCLMFEGFDRNDLNRRAQEDARLNIYEPDAYVLATLGPEPSFDPVGNLRHANVGSRLQDPRIEEGEADIRRVEEDLARHPNAHFLIAFLVVLLFVESAGAIYVMRDRKSTRLNSSHLGIS